MKKNMKRMMTFLLAAAMGIGCLSGCGSSGTETTGTASESSGQLTLEQIKEKGKLVVATEAAYEPFEYLDGDKIIGYDADIFYQTKINKDDFLKQFNIENKYDKIVSFVGKFTYIKGIDILLKAATLYENSNILTILAGDGELFDDMKKLAKKLNLKNIFFIKNQPQDILNKLYNIADVSIISSRSEAFGLVSIEAMACGTPVIGSDIGGISDIITDDTGMLFESENYHDLATKIKQVINNKFFDRNYIAKYTKDKFSQENFTKKLIDIYEKATLK